MPRAALLGLLALAVFMFAAMLRQFREVTIPLTVVLVVLAGVEYFREKRAAP